MTNTTATVRRTTVSARKVANMGPAYTRTWDGTRVAHTTYDGDVLVGVVEWADFATYPVVRFPDGRWARLDYTLNVVVDEAAR